MPAIEFEHASFSYDGRNRAVDDLSLSVDAGTFLCVLGGNGSGKSTFAKLTNALLTPDDGRVVVLGHDTSDPANVFFVRSNAGMVFQNPDDQIVASIIENDVAFGPENLGVPADELRERVTAALERVGLQGFESKQTETLSGGQKQRVAVAGVLAMQPQILILDEASAMLDPRGRAGLMRVCRELNATGLTIVLITHFMEEAAQADRVVVLDHGTVALDGAPDDVLLQADQLTRLALEVPFTTRLSLALRQRGVPLAVHASEDALERELVALLEAAGASGDSAAVVGGGDDAPAGDEAEGERVIEFQDVSFTYEAVSQERRRKTSAAPTGKQADWGRAPDEYWALQDVSFSVRRGEFFGIAGHTGSGKSTLIQLANGLLTPTRGAVRAHGREPSGKHAGAAARREVGVVFQYPENQLFAATVFDDVAFGPRNLGQQADDVERSVRRALEMVHLDVDELRDRSPFELSGGQQRRVAIAGVLAMSPRTLVLDEPVAGLDPRAKQRLLNLLAELHDEQGMTVVVVSHNMDDLAELCDRILVLNEGRRYAVGTPQHVFADEQALKGIGLGVPHTTRLANRLAAAGAPLPVRTVPTLDELAQALAQRLESSREGC